MKTQSIRLLDVFFLGPLMFYAGSRRESLDDFTRAVLLLGGIATVAYNWRNYVIQRQLENQ